MQQWIAACLVLGVVNFAVAAPPPLPPVAPSALINQALDKQVELKINAPLPKAMEQIGDQTGVRITAEAQVWELLPWGQLTNINATIRNQTLREALEAITRKLGLTFQLGEDAVELLPMPALSRLGRRATVEELSALDLLASTPADTITAPLPAEKLIAAIDQKLVAIKAPFAVENRMGSAAKPGQLIRVARHATLTDALEELTRQTDLTWYPWGKRIVVLPKTDQIRMQLSKSITVRFNDVDVQQVLTELSARAGVPFALEPGAIQRIPPEYRNIRLILDHASIRQALETIGGFTGLGFTIRDHSIYFWNQSRPTTSSHSGHLIGLLQLPDIGVAVPIRDTDVSPEVQQYIESKTTHAMKQLEQMMADEGFKPTTRP
jgi:hypothetical protein